MDKRNLEYLTTILKRDSDISFDNLMEEMSLKKEFIIGILLTISDNYIK